jgi:peptide deformylase
VSLLPIIVAPDPRLKQVAKPVAKVDDDVRRLMDDMLETMYDAPGIGLAAPQVGVQKRVIVLDIARDNEPPQPLRMANPQVIAASDELVVYEEGCLSLPQQYSEVERPARVTVAYLDETGKKRTMDAEAMLATCIQHEIDHLDGVLFVDHISRVKRSIILRKLTKAKKAGTLSSTPSTSPAL